MAFSRSWREAAPGLIVALAWTLAGCGEPAPAPAPETPQAPVETPKVTKGKGKRAPDPKLEMGIAELREQRRKEAAGKAP
ncbi:hypothetical protein [Planctomyces sp. SH-PL62]|uniref:hypothetical protein n=1 Tax=Planctomyces sp. SH-PL62 TaxID=1636152 RepID=UPI00078B6FAF|nr:hypothetical protein [Planctomyces sp. SH-PL62]AMV40530.1 hypothetical protein VT85_24080 [Planctomyces sp. SH-PL62]